MKKFISIILALFIMLVPMAGCKEENDNKATLTLNHSSLNLPLFGEADLIASYENVSEITWENNNERVITITEHGNYVKVSAKEDGVAIITVSGGDKTAQCVVVVSESNYALGVTIDKLGDVEIQENATMYVPATATYGGVTVDAKITYSIVDEEIATVTQDGVVTGVADGETTLNVQAEYNGMRSSVASIKVKVKGGPALVLSSTYINLYEYDKTVSQSYYPNLNDFSVYIVEDGVKVWDISYTLDNTDPSVATFESGNIVSGSVGSTMMTVTCEYKGETYVGYLFVSVRKIPVVEITLSETDILLYTNPVDETVYTTTQTLTSRIKIDGRAISDTVTWGIEAGNSAATINNKGIVKALGVGKAVISGSYTYNGKTYKETCDVEVIEDLFFGAYKLDPNAETGPDLAVAYLSNTYNTLKISNVDLTDTTDLDIVRLTAPSNSVSKTPIYRIFIRATDVNDENNWVELIYTYYNNGATYGSNGYAVNTSAWTMSNTKVIGIAGQGDTVSYMTSTSSKSGSNRLNGAGIGKYNNNCSLRLGQPFGADYDKYMIGMSVIDDEVYLNYTPAGSNATRTSDNLFTKALQQTLLADGTEYANPVFDGFTKNNVEKVNVTIKVQINGSNVITPIIIDTVGGVAVTADSIANMSIVKN